MRSIAVKVKYFSMIEESDIETIPLNPKQVGFLLSRKKDGFAEVFDSAVKERLAIGKQLRLVLEDGTPPKNLLRESLEQRIRKGVPSNGTIYLEEDGSLINVHQRCPYTIEPAELVQRLEEPLGASSMEELRGEFDREIWDDFLAYTRRRLMEPAHGHHSVVNPQQRIRGCSAELLLRVLLQRIARTPSPRHQPVLSLIDRTVPFTLPPANEGAEPWFGLNFLPFHNCNLEAHYGSFSKTVTEFDAVAITGLKPRESNKTFSALYLCDVTTSCRELQNKLTPKRQDRIADFRDFMEGNGLALHQFNILVYDPKWPVRYLRSLGKEGNHVVLLPLNGLIEEVSQAAAEDLKIHLETRETTATLGPRKSLSQSKIG